MKSLTRCALLLTSLTASIANSAVHIQNMGTLADGPLRYSVNHLSMSSSGRYVMWKSTTQAPDPNPGEFYYIRDIKSGISEKLLQSESKATICYELSGNGRYAAMNYRVTGSYSDEDVTLYDRVTGQETFIARTNASECGTKVSNNGDVAYLDGTNNALYFHHSETNTTTFISNNARVGNFSDDGQYLAYINFNDNNRVYLFDTQTQTSRVVSNLPATNVAISGDASTIFFGTSHDANEQTSAHTLIKFDLATQTIQSFSMDAHFIDSVRNISSSRDGRFISLFASISDDHPNRDETLNWGSRVFRLDTNTNTMAYMWTTFDGEAPRGIFNLRNYISSDGSIVSYCSQAKNILDIDLRSGEELYHAFSDDGFARRYLFIDIMSSDNAYMPFDPLTLIDDNLWEGIVEFDDVGSDFFFQTGGRWIDGEYQPTNDSAVWGDFNNDGIARTGETQIRAPEGAGKYRITFNDTNGAYTIEKLDTDIQRTVVFIYGRTNPGQDMFIRGGIDHAWANTYGGRNCTSTNYECSIPIISHNNTRNNTTAPWKVGDYFLDWYGSESSQSNESQGTPLDWTGNYWPSDWGPMKTVAEHGSGVTPLNTYGLHFWMLDVDLDCSRTENGWFELKSYISNGPGWENDVNQSGTP